MVKLFKEGKASHHLKLLGADAARDKQVITDEATAPKRPNIYKHAVEIEFLGDYPSDKKTKGQIKSAIGCIILIRYYLASENGRFVWDKYKLKIPVIGILIHRATMVRFTRFFSMSIGAGVPLITTLTVVARALDNVYIEGRILGMQAGIERGESIIIGMMGEFPGRRKRPDWQCTAHYTLEDN